MGVQEIAEVAQFAPPPVGAALVGPGLELSKQEAQLRRMRLEAPLDGIATLPRANEDAPIELLALASDKMLKHFVLPLVRPPSGARGSRAPGTWGPQSDTERSTSERGSGVGDSALCR